MRVKDEKGFTLIEIMLVVLILAMLAAVAIPRLTSSAQLARQKADITSGREVKAALDRYQIENGSYPLITEVKAENGEISADSFIPQYINRLDSTVTQQTADEDHKGFGLKELGSGGTLSAPERLIMIYLNSSGTAGEVVVYNDDLSQILWSSLNINT